MATKFDPILGKLREEDAGSGIAALVDDTSPQLGGDLDLNGNVITDLFVGVTSEKTADYTILDTDGEILFVLGRGTAADREFTLPTLSANLGVTDRCKNISDYLLTVIGESRGTDAAEAGTTATVINATAHGFVAGQVLRMTSGDESGEERRIASVVADAITLGNALSGAPSATETFEVFDGIEGESRKILGKGEQLNFYGSDLTDDEWVVN